jgi:FAD/FMN-containing dehydrogenase
MHRRLMLRSTAAAAAATLLPRRAFAEWSGLAWQDPTDLLAVRGDGSKVTLKGAALKELKAALRGRLLFAKDAGYDEARQVLNPTIDRHPALVIQPTGVADVRTAVAFARANSLLVAVKCGGHSFSGQSTCDGGLQIDLSLFRGVRVDPTARRAWVAGGTLLGAVDHEAMSHGLVTPLGTVSHTGAGGLTTGGGFGRVARRFGLALDNVMSVDVVTADGTFHHASKDENPDLYWAVRGGGGNFGVVTTFEFALHPMQRRVAGGQLIFPFAKAREVLQVYAEYSVAAPDELYLDCFVSPPSTAGGNDGAAGILICYSGTADPDKVLAPIRKIGGAVVDQVKPIDYVALQRSTDVTDPRATGSYVKNGFTSEITSKLIDTALAGLRGDPRRSSTFFFQHLGGAIGRVDPAATAFAYRYAKHNMMILTSWKVSEDQGPPIAYSREYW